MPLEKSHFLLKITFISNRGGTKKDIFRSSAVPCSKFAGLISKHFSTKNIDIGHKM